MTNSTYSTMPVMLHLSIWLCTTLRRPLPLSLPPCCRSYLSPSYCTVLYSGTGLLLLTLFCLSSIRGSDAHVDPVLASAGQTNTVHPDPRPTLQRDLATSLTSQYQYDSSSIRGSVRGSVIRHNTTPVDGEDDDSTAYLPVYWSIR